MYMTGDLARFASDGTLQFHGRIDQQIKLRGYRIEPGEIETLLRRHMQVRDVVVLVRETGAHNQQLVAYVVPTAEDRGLKIEDSSEGANQELSSILYPLSSELRAFLKQQLPDYMIPALFVFLEALPLTPNGKVDRRALPAPDRTKYKRDKVYVAPRTPVEVLLAGIWADLLRLEQIGVDDNFFVLGGDSLLVMRVVAHARQLGLWLTPRQVFQHQTIAEMAMYLDTDLTIQAERQVVYARSAALEQNELRSTEMVLPVGTLSGVHAEQGVLTGFVPLTPVQHKFFKQSSPDPHHWNVGKMLKLHQSVNPELLEQAVYHIIKHHDALRLRFVQKNSIWQQFIASIDDKVPFIKVDLSNLIYTEQRSTIEAIAAKQQASLNLSEGPMMRVVLFEVRAHQPARLLIIVNHLICDAFSLDIILEDLFTAYQLLISGKTVQLPPKTTSFKYWAERQEDLAQSIALRQELDYWLTTLQTPVAQLPVDKSGGTLTEATARTVKASLTMEESHILLSETLHANQTTITDILLTALALAFMRWTGEHSWLIEVVSHGRTTNYDDIDLSRSVGWLVTHTPVLLKLESTHSAKANLQDVKEQTRRIPNNGFGYEMLRYLSKDIEVINRLASMPHSEVIFNFFGRFNNESVNSIVSPAEENVGPIGEHKNVPRFRLIFNGIILDSQLHLSLTYSEDVYYHSTVEKLAQ